MTPRTNARWAGAMFLLYIATGIGSMILSRQASSGAGIAARLTSMAQNETTMRITVLLTLLTFVYAVGLGVTLYALTRDEDQDIALLGLCGRLSEGVIGAVSAVRTLGLIAIATAKSATPADEAAANALAGMLLQQGGWQASIAALCFALGSTCFSYLFLRSRSIPAPLAWLGVVASVLLVIALPLGVAGFLRGTLAYVVWIPMALFEVALALWLIFKGVTPTPRAAIA